MNTYAAPSLKLERKKLRRISMAANRCEVRDVDVVLLCVTLIGLICLAVLNKTQMGFINPVVLSSFSHKFTDLFKIPESCTETTDYFNYNSSAMSADKKELELRLSKAANPDKTVIITSLNEAWAQNNSMIDLFLQSFREGNGTEHLLKNLLIIAVDNKALRRCRQIHKHCYLMKTEGMDFSAEKLFMSKDYLKMMWRRLRFFGQVLETGYNFVFSDMRFRGDLLYKLDIDSREPEECNFDSRGRKPKGQSTRHQMKTKSVQDNEKFAESNFHLRRNKNKHMACKQEPGNENYDNVDKESKSVPADFWLREEEALERKKKLMSFKEMTDAYMHPFCLDIFISKSSVCACIVHRVTCNVVAVAQSISKDMKSNLISKKDLTACAAVGGILAQRALADDIYTAVYTPRKGDKLEGKLMVVLQSIIDHGVDIKVRLKQRRPKNCGYMGAGVMADNEENGLKVLQ